MRDSGSEQDRKPSAGPAGETAAAQVTAQAADGDAAGGGASDGGAADGGAAGGASQDSAAEARGAEDGAVEDSEDSAADSRYLGRGATVTAVGSSGLTRTFTLDIGNLTGGTGAVAAGGQPLTGLLVSSARVMAGEETGGPLVNLSGQAIGINVAGTGSRLHHTGFAVPINEALAVARQILAAHSH
jgi:S1-C subfamily serine protease